VPFLYFGGILSAAYKAPPNGRKHIYGLSLLFRKLNFLMRKLLRV